MKSKTIFVLSLLVISVSAQAAQEQQKAAVQNDGQGQKSTQPPNSTENNPAYKEAMRLREAAKHYAFLAQKNIERSKVLIEQNTKMAEEIKKENSVQDKTMTMAKTLKAILEKFSYRF